jgi:methylmalonyl-CoA mutase N-terminal domain/subunit
MALPTEESVQVALRTQQIIAYESGVADTVDPLGGSYFVESLTQQTEKDAYHYISEVDRLGGALKAIESGYVQKEIATSAYEYQKAVDTSEQVVVGVNKFNVKEELEHQVLEIGMEVEQKQKERLSALRKRRDNAKVSQLLEKVKQVANTDENLMPILIETVKEYATVGEISDALREVFGEYREPAVL